MKESDAISLTKYQNNILLFLCINGVIRCFLQIITSLVLMLGLVVLLTAPQIVLGNPNDDRVIPLLSIINEGYGAPLRCRDMGESCGFRMPCCAGFTCVFEERPMVRYRCYP